MAKIKLNLDSTDALTFTRKVNIPTPSGQPLVIPFVFRHRTREEMADLIEAHAKRATEHADSVKDDSTDKPLREYVSAGIERDVQAVMDVASGWEADIEFNAKHLSRLFSLYGGAAKAIMDDYRVSMNEGRLGN